MTAPAIEDRQITPEALLATTPEKRHDVRVWLEAHSFDPEQCTAIVVEDGKVYVKTQAIDVERNVTETVHRVLLVKEQPPIVG